MQRSKHAQQIADRFRELVEDAGHSLDDTHYDELSLLIEAGIDAALVDYMELTAKKLDALAHEVRHSSQFFNE